MNRRYSGASAIGVVLVIAALIAMAVILFPVFARDDGRPTGVILDGAQRPMPGATLRFRDDMGNVVEELTTDQSGQFRRHHLGALCQDSIDGFAFAHFIHSTGGSDHYYFSPLGSQTARFHDTNYNPMKGLAVSFVPDQRTWLTASMPKSIDCLCNRDGMVNLPNVPLSVRFDIQSRDRRYVIWSVQAVASSQAVGYEVTVVPSATIIGRLLSSDGRPLGGYYAFVVSGSDTDIDERRYASGVTGASGRFRIPSLKPGTYYVSAKPPLNFHSIAPAQAVTINSGQTVAVQIRASSRQAGRPPRQWRGGRPCL